MSNYYDSLNILFAQYFFLWPAFNVAHPSWAEKCKVNERDSDKTTNGGSILLKH